MDVTIHKPTDKSLAAHYARDNLLSIIKQTINDLGKTPETVTISDLAPMDEFHVGSQDATKMLFEKIGLSSQHHLLDLGCGLGGAARYISHHYGCKVNGVDLTPEFVAVGKEICRWFGLEDQISLQQCSVMNLPFAENYFDGAYMIHVGMNIEDKISLFKEVSRSLKHNGFFVIFDLMQIDSGELKYPVPWSATEATSFLVSSGGYQYALEHAGFKIDLVLNHHAFAIEFYQRMQKQIEKHGPSPMGLHLLMGEDTQTRLTNAYSAILEGVIAPIQIVARKR